MNWTKWKRNSSCCPSLGCNYSAPTSKLNMTNHLTESIFCPETWTRRIVWHIWSFLICSGIRCRLSEITINKTQFLQTRIYQSSQTEQSPWIRTWEHEWKIPAVKATLGFYSLVTERGANAAQFDALPVTHSVGGLRSSDLVSKKLRTSSLWEMGVGSFNKACGKE